MIEIYSQEEAQAYYAAGGDTDVLAESGWYVCEDCGDIFDIDYDGDEVPTQCFPCWVG